MISKSPSRNHSYITEPQNEGLPTKNIMVSGLDFKYSGICFIKSTEILIKYVIFQIKVHGLGRDNFVNKFL